LQVVEMSTIPAKGWQNRNISRFCLAGKPRQRQANSLPTIDRQSRTDRSSGRQRCRLSLHRRPQEAQRHLGRRHPRKIPRQSADDGAGHVDGRCWPEARRQARLTGRVSRDAALSGDGLIGMSTARKDLLRRAKGLRAICRRAYSRTRCYRKRRCGRPRLGRALAMDWRGAIWPTPRLGQADRPDLARR
jgi:hypothetical protein